MRLSTILSLSLFAAPVLLLGCSVQQAPTGEAQQAEQEQGEHEDDASPADCPAQVPAALTPAADQRLEFSYIGSGVQIYACTATGWVFQAPRADLLKDDGKIKGKHYAGPTWESIDGSTVVGSKVAGANSPTGAIPWLLLKAVSHGPVSGKFSNVTTIQRLNTSGGVAPTTGCDATTIGAIAEVPYEAGYFFYTTHTPEHHANRQCGQ